MTLCRLEHKNTLILCIAYVLQLSLPHTKRSKGEVLLHKFPGENGTSVNATREEYFENEVPMRIKGSIWFYDVSWVHV